MQPYHIWCASTFSKPVVLYHRFIHLTMDTTEAAPAFHRGRVLSHVTIDFTRAPFLSLSFKTWACMSSDSVTSLHSFSEENKAPAPSYQSLPLVMPSTARITKEQPYHFCMRLDRWV